MRSIALIALAILAVNAAPIRADEANTVPGFAKRDQHDHALAALQASSPDDFAAATQYDEPDTKKRDEQDDILAALQTSSPDDFAAATQYDEPETKKRRGEE